jgi:hypothetical protein
MIQKYFKSGFFGGLAMQSVKPLQSLQLATGLSTPRFAGLLSLPDAQHNRHQDFLFLLSKTKELFPKPQCLSPQ